MTHSFNLKNQMKIDILAEYLGESAKHFELCR